MGLNQETMANMDKEKFDEFKENESEDERSES